MYKDEREASRWRAEALARERDELTSKLRKREEKILNLELELLALKNQPPVYYVDSYPNRRPQQISTRPRSLRPSPKKFALAVGSLFVTLPSTFLAFMQLQNSQWDSVPARFGYMLILCLGFALLLWSVGVFLMDYFGESEITL